MRARPEDHVAIREMLEVIERAQEVVARGSATFFARHNHVEFLAGRMVIIDLDTAAEGVSSAFKSAWPGPWRQLARARDTYAHHYDDVDRGVVWEVLASRLPRWAADLATAVEMGAGGEEGQ